LVSAQAGFELILWNVGDVATRRQSCWYRRDIVIKQEDSLVINVMQLVVIE
jgi:hypothetical protein